MSSKCLLLSVHCTNDFQELPGAICVKITGDLLEAVAQISQCATAMDLSDAGKYWSFGTPKVIDENVAEHLAREECLVADLEDYEDIEDIGGDRGHKLWVASDFVWFAYYDKYSDAIIESAMLSIDRFNKLATGA